MLAVVGRERLFHFCNSVLFDLFLFSFFEFVLRLSFYFYFSLFNPKHLILFGVTLYKMADLTDKGHGMAKGHEMENREPGYVADTTERNINYLKIKNGRRWFQGEKKEKQMDKKRKEIYKQ